MNKRSSFFACAAVVGMSVVGASMHGCYWDDALYKKYAEGSHLVTCRGVCMKDNNPIANSISKENCRGDNTQWISGKSENGGTCVVRTRRGCEAIAKEFEDEEVRWVEYDYQTLQLSAYRYVRFEPEGEYDLKYDADYRRKLKGKYYCGTFEAISRGEGEGECTDAEKREIDESFAGTICPLSAHSCSTMQGFDSEKIDGTSPVPIGICSKCASDQIICDGVCVSLWSDDNCGACGNKCGEGFYCRAANGEDGRIAKCAIKLDCLSGDGSEIEEGYRVCLYKDEQGKEDKRCVSADDIKTCGGCPPGSEDVSPDGVKMHGAVCNESKHEVCHNRECTSKPTCEVGKIACYCNASTGRCSEKYTPGSGDAFYCIEPAGASTCGAKSCDDLGESCEANKVCASNGDSHECVCPEGTFWVEKLNRCMGPNDDETCGIISETNLDVPGCDKATSACRDGKCVCFSGTVMCEDGEGNARCVRPNDEAFCGAKLNEVDGTCKAKRTDEKGNEIAGDYEVCDDTQECIGGKCVCKPGYAACAANGEQTGKCVNTKEGDKDSEAFKYCGARGTCNSDSVASGDFKGVSCESIDAEKCVYDATSGLSECACGEGLAMCNGKCIDPKTDINYCGADASCGNYVDCASLGTGAKCNEGECGCVERRTKVWISEKGRYECRDTDNDALCCGVTEADGKTVCAANCWSENKVCNGGMCAQPSCKEGVEVLCGGVCINPESGEFEYLNLEIIDGKCRCVTKKFVEDGEKFSGIEAGKKFITYCNTDNDMTNGCEGVLNDALNCGKCAEKAGKDEYVACNRDERRECGYDRDNNAIRECTCEQPKNEEDGYVEFCQYSNIRCVNLKQYNMKDCFTCEDGFADENGDLAKATMDENGGYGRLIDGCEVDFNSDVNNCGKKGNVCNKDEMHALEVQCVGGVCKSVICKPGYADCDGDGGICEADLSTTENCQICGKRCLQGQACESNGCRYGEGGGCSNCTLRPDDCKEGLKLWRKCLWFGCKVFYNEYHCATSKPSDWYWKEVK